MNIIKKHINHNYTGDYGMSGAAKLIEADTGWYWIADSFCGMDSLEGGAMRPFVTKISEEIARKIIAVWDTENEDWKIDMSDFWGGLDGYLVELGVNFGNTFRADAVKWSDQLTSA